MATNIARRLAKLANNLQLQSNELASIRAEIAPLLADTKKVELVGVREAADLLNVKPDLISTWLYRGNLPEPLARLSAGPVWSKAQLLEWKREKMR